MLLTLLLLISLFFLTLFVYAKTTPKHIHARSRALYNLAVFVLALLVCLIVYAHTYLNSGLSIERAMLSILAYLQSLLGVSIVLIVGGLFRNLILYRRKK